MFEFPPNRLNRKTMNVSLSITTVEYVYYNGYSAHVVVCEVGQHERRYHSRDDSDDAAEPLQHACKTEQRLHSTRARIIRHGERARSTNADTS